MFRMREETHIYADALRSFRQRQVESGVRQQWFMVTEAPGVSVATIRMFMWPLRRMEGSGGGLTLNRCVRARAAQRARRGRARDLTETLSDLDYGRTRARLADAVWSGCVISGSVIRLSAPGCRCQLQARR